ncbi:MAG: CC0125/CC1285 family lipoprotein [Geminicoccaceae bacterium]
MKFRLSAIIRTAVAAALMTTLAACTVPPTPYQGAPENDGYGYSSQQLETTRFNVRFVGNSSTPRDTVESFALYRAAELTLETGHDYFRVASKDVEPLINSVHGASPRVGIGVGSGGGGFGWGVSTGVNVGGGGRADYSYAASMDILVFKGEKPADDRDAYSAWDVVDSLKSKVRPLASPATAPASGGEAEGEGEAAQ